MLLPHPCEPAEAFGPGCRQQTARQHVQQPVQNQGNQHDARQPKAVPDRQISPFEYAWNHTIRVRL